MLEEIDTPANDRGGRGTEGRVQEYPLGLLAASSRVIDYGAELHGWCVAEGTGAGAARIRIRDGRDANGPVLAPIVVPANGTSVVMLGGAGIAAETGVYLEVASGSVEVTLYLKAPLRPRS